MKYFGIVFLLSSFGFSIANVPLLSQTEVYTRDGPVSLTTPRLGEAIGYDGTWMAYTYKNGGVYLRKFDSLGQEIPSSYQSLSNLGDGGARYVVVRNNQLAVSGLGSTKVYYYSNSNTWEPHVASIGYGPTSGLDYYGSRLSMSRDGKRMVICDKETKVFDRPAALWQGTTQFSSNVASSTVSCAISDDGLIIASCQYTNCHIWAFQDGLWNQRLEILTTSPNIIVDDGNFRSVHVSPDGNWVFVAQTYYSGSEPKWGVGDNVVNVYQRTGTNFAHTGQKLSVPNIQGVGGESSWGLEMTQDPISGRLYISDQVATIDGKSKVGMIRAFLYNGSEWVPEFDTVPESRNALSEHGSNMDVYGNLLGHSSPDYNDGSNAQQGKIFLSQLITASPTVSPTGSPTGSPSKAPTFAPTYGSHTVVCDSSSVDCNVVTDFDFSYKEMEIIPYSVNAATVVQSQSYEFVMEYQTETPFQLLNEIRVCEYSTAQTLSCEGVKMWLDGVIASSVVVTDSDGRQCCDFDTFGVFTRANIENTEGNLFFLMNNAYPGPARRRQLQEVQNLVFERTNDPIVPNEVAILYAFHLDDTELVIDGDNTRITLSVNDVDHSNNPDFNHSACDNKDLTMATIELSGCTLTLDAQTVPGKYEYLMPSVDYERCSSSVTTVDGQILYNSTIDLPDNDGQCYYFEPGNDIQPITVIIEQDSITDATQETTALGISVTNITTERCLPYEDYVLAHAKIVYTVRYKFNGTDVNLINTPFLNSVTNPVTTVSKTCTDNECIFVLKSSQCEPIYIADDGTGCVFDRNDVYLLNELSVTEVGNPYSPISYTHIVDPLDTNTETITYPLSHCTTPDYLQFVNVTDQYNYEVNIENVATADWTIQEDIVDLFQELVVRLRIIDGPAFTNQDLQINTVKLTVVDGVGGAELSQFTFRLNDKVALMSFSGSEFYEDAHFCRYFDNDACTPFYDTATSRSNPFVVSTLAPRLDDICQRTVDDTKTDFFSFLFPTWLERVDTSSLVLNIEVTARLQVCNSISNDGRPRKLQQETQKLQYLTTSKVFELNSIQNNENTTTPTISPSSSPTVPVTVAETEEDKLSNGEIAGITIGVLSCVGAIVFAVAYKQKHTYLGLAANVDF